MTIDDEKVRHIARLACLDLTDEQVSSFGRQLSSILGYIDQLSELGSLEGVAPFVYPAENVSVFRHGSGRPLSAEEALGNAPERLGNYFVVPRILEE